jgi:tetratricopeptide (TPR) repeat protein
MADDAVTTIVAMRDSLIQQGIERAVLGREIRRLSLALILPAAHRLSALWFRTIAVLSLQRAELGLAESTLGWGLKLCPDDPDLLLLSGTLHQAYADPRVQRFAGRARTPERIPFGAPLSRGELAPLAEGPRSAEHELALAEASLRRALALQPALGAARVRLAHVLTDRGGNAEAASLAAAALEHGLPPFYESYALLILGRSSARLGRLDDARAAFTRAATLAPAAQAPRVGLAQVALAEGRATAALAQLTSLSNPGHPQSAPDEHWLVYFRVHDPGAETLLTELREAVR